MLAVEKMGTFSIAIVSWLARWTVTGEKDKKVGRGLHFRSLDKLGGIGHQTLPRE